VRRAVLSQLAFHPDLASGGSVNPVPTSRRPPLPLQFLVASGEFDCCQRCCLRAFVVCHRQSFQQALAPCLSLCSCRRSVLAPLEESSSEVCASDVPHRGAGAIASRGRALRAAAHRPKRQRERSAAGTGDGLEGSADGTLDESEGVQLAGGAAAALPHELRLGRGGAAPAAAVVVFPATSGTHAASFDGDLDDEAGDSDLDGAEGEEAGEHGAGGKRRAGRGGGNRKERKNERERQRRQEINDAFDDILHLLTVEGRRKINKAEKADILRGACDEIRLLRGRLQQQLQPVSGHSQPGPLQVLQLGSGTGPPSADRRGLVHRGIAAPLGSASDGLSASAAGAGLSTASRNPFSGSAHASPAGGADYLSTVPVAVAACGAADSTGMRYTFGGSSAAGAGPVIGVAAGWPPEVSGLHRTSPAYLATHGRGPGAAPHGKAPSYAAAAGHATHHNPAAYNPLAGPVAGAHLHMQGVASADYGAPGSAHAVAAAPSGAAAPFPSAFAHVGGVERGRMSAGDRGFGAHNEPSVSGDELSAGAMKHQAGFDLDGSGGYHRPRSEAVGGVPVSRRAPQFTRKRDAGPAPTGIQHQDFSLSPPLERAVPGLSHTGAMPPVDIGRSAPEAYGFALLPHGERRQEAETAAAAVAAPHSGTMPLPAPPSGRELQRAARVNARPIAAAPLLSQGQALDADGVFSPALALPAAGGSAASVSQASILSSAAGSSMATGSIASAAGSTAANRHGLGGQDHTGRSSTPNIDADTYSSASRTSATTTTSVPSQQSGGTYGQRTGQSRGTATTAGAASLGEASLGGFSADAFLVGPSESSHESSRGGSPAKAHSHAGAAQLLYASADQPPVRARPLAPHPAPGNAGHSGQPTIAGGAPSVVSHLRSQVADIHISRGAFDARLRAGPPLHSQPRQPRSHEQPAHPGWNASDLQQGDAWEAVPAGTAAASHQLPFAVSGRCGHADARSDLGASTAAAAAVSARDDKGLHPQLPPLSHGAALDGPGPAGHQLALPPQRPLLPSGIADGTAPPFPTGASDGPALPAFPPIDDSLFADAEEL